MKITLAAILVVLLFAVLAAPGAAQEKGKVYYVCNCKDDCACNSIAKEPGKCSCGTELVAMHLLAIENGKAVFCRCGASCTCERSKEDPNKCACGKPVKYVSLKGKYICDCGAACKCGSISDTPGQCACGKEMKQVM